MSQRMIGLHALLALVLSTLGGCDAGGPDDLGDDDAVAGGKADAIFGVEEGTPQARAILRLVNEADFGTLDDFVGLDRRAAENIVADRTRDDDGLVGFQTLAELDAVGFVGKSAFGRLLDYVLDEDLLGQSLRISTFNIRWFGLDGDLHGSFGTESRVGTVRAFIDAHMADRDVLVFQEIVDKDLFTSEVVPDHDCVSYEGSGGKHQHIMVCTTDEYRLVPADDDDDFAFEALNTSGFLRPGVHGTLVTATGTPVANLIAVHLKANEFSTEKRLVQAEILADRVATLRERSGLPIITIGDFNTHLAKDTGLADNDEDLVADVLEPLVRVQLPVTFTYQEKDGTRFRLDQSLLSPDILVDGVVSPGACDLDPVADAAAIAEHYDTLSDHCPLIIDLALP